MAEITIDIMREGDVERVYEIETRSFSIPWSLASFQSEVRNPAARYLLLKEDGQIVAYAGMWLVLDEAHVTNIAVAPEKRGMGYGEMLTRALVQLASDSGMTWMTLECRKNNIAAQNLYRKLGFIDVGVRKRYYSDTGEDALVMALEKLPEPHPEDDPFLVVEGPEDI
jgi:ribosomal-protein-alanine N-acetyltransferase